MQVYTAEVEAISREPYEGNVFNLETENEEYVVLDVVVHNCPHLWSITYEKVAPTDCATLWMGQ